MKLCLHRDLYAEPAVRQGLVAFAQLATLTLDEDGADWVITIADPHPHFGAHVADELANYVLLLTVKAR